MVDHPHSLLCVAYAEDKHIEDGGDKVGVLDMPNPPLRYWININIYKDHLIESISIYIKIHFDIFLAEWKVKS